MGFWETAPLYERILAAIVSLILGGAFVGGFVAIFTVLLLGVLGIVCTPLQSRFSALVAGRGYRRRFVFIRFLVPWAYILPASTSARLPTHRPASRELFLHILWLWGTVGPSGTIVLLFGVPLVGTAVDTALGTDSFSVVDLGFTRRLGVNVLLISGYLLLIFLAGTFTFFAFRAWLSSFRQAGADHSSAEDGLIDSTLASYASPFRRAVRRCAGSFGFFIVLFVIWFVTQLQIPGTTPF